MSLIAKKLGIKIQDVRKSGVYSTQRRQDDE
jgi:hypothetical protein